MSNVISVPRYAGHAWVGGALPERVAPWLGDDALLQSRAYDDEATRVAVERYLAGRPWVWPNELIYVLCDIHADAEAFLRSLVASGGVAKLGPGDFDFELTAEGRTATFLVAGDCLDKGPSNLRLLRCLRRLIDIGARVVLLAGNHDVRALVGMRTAGAREPRLAHLFVRMGKKAVPLFKEIYDTYLADDVFDESLATQTQLFQKLFPEASWYRAFPEAVRGVISPQKIEQELVRIREKTEDLEKGCARAGLSLAKVDAVIAKFHELFLTPDGEFAWLFDRMQLAHRAGSVLFIHAGVDDCLAARLRDEGVDGVNGWFRSLMHGDLFDLYHGAAGNGFRTKYRDTDWPLTCDGVRMLHDAGVYAVAHGHRNIFNGQRIIFRQGMLNFECDASIDRNTRTLHDIEHVGAAVTIFRPDGCVLGISTDHATAKLFDVAAGTTLTTTRHMPNNQELAMDEERSMDGKISFDSRMTRDEAVAYFDAIVKGLKTGAIHFRRNDEELALEAGPHLDIEVKASRKGKKQKVEIELSWRTETPAELEID